MVVEIHEDQPLPIPGVRRVAVHEAVGTSGTVGVPIAWAVMPEMTMTLALNVGDDIILAWTGNIWVAANNWGELRFTVNGAPVSFEYRAGLTAAASPVARRNARTFVQRYVVPATGNYTLALEWQAPAINNITVQLNERVLTVVRFY